MPSNALLIACSLSDPEQQENITLKQVRTASNEPFATFTFYYRSEGKPVYLCCLLLNPVLIDR